VDQQPAAPEADYINAQVTSFTMRYLKEDLAELMQKNGIRFSELAIGFHGDPHIQAQLL
jgi:hypothetical protein